MQSLTAAKCAAISLSHCSNWELFWVYEEFVGNNFSATVGSISNHNNRHFHCTPHSQTNTETLLCWWISCRHRQTYKQNCTEMTQMTLKRQQL